MTVKDPPAAPVRRHGKIGYYDFGKITIASDEKLTRGQARRIAREAERAYESDTLETGRGKRGPGAALTVGVFSDKTFAEFTGDKKGQLFGVQTDRNTLVVRDDIVHAKPGDRAVLAHELAHIQDERLAGGNRVYKIPSFLREGKAVVLGNKYVASRHQKNPAVAETARALGGYTANDAREVFKNFRGDPRDEIKRGNGARDERIGALYVEFLRTRFNGGSPDALAKLSKLTKDVGKGDTFAEAFQKQFGVPPGQAEDAFVKFMEETQRCPEDRLRGTIYA